ncbi:hypothetical protein ACFQZ4_53530 [Catellatospora coxensis]
MSTLPNPAPDHAADFSALVSSLAAPAILASRSLFMAGFADELRVATLIEVAALPPRWPVRSPWPGTSTCDR